jgi:hypothetical protein
MILSVDYKVGKSRKTYNYLIFFNEASKGIKEILRDKDEAFVISATKMSDNLVTTPDLIFDIKIYKVRVIGSKNIIEAIHTNKKGFSISPYAP